MPRVNIPFSTILAPLEMFSTLQRLDLLPGWPWFPHPRSFIPFSLPSPLQLPMLPTSFTLRSTAEFLVSIAGSPFLLWWMISIVKPMFGTKLRAYVRATIPKPYKPDQLSLEAASKDELDDENIPGLGNGPSRSEGQWESESFSEELAKDLQYIGRSFQILRDIITGFFVSNPRAEKDDLLKTQRCTLQQIDPDASMPSTVPSSSTTTSATPHTSSTSTPQPATPQPAIEIINETENTGILHMNLHVPDGEPIQEPSPTDNNDSDFLPANNTHIQNKTYIMRKLDSPYHRITALTAYAADSIAHHVSAQITDLLFLPIETLFVRSLAMAFLTSPRADPQAQAAAARWKSEIYPLGGWCGLGRQGGWRAMGDYAGKMMLVFGMEMGINFAIWQACTGAAWVVGRRRFGWGRL